MLGAVIGDIIGSRFEADNHKSKEFDLFTRDSCPTDDSIMTLAVAKALLASREDWSQLSKNAVKYMQEIGRQYPNCGCGGLAQAYYGIPTPIRNQAMAYLDDHLVEIVDTFESAYPIHPNK